MIVKLLIEHHLEFLSLKGGCRGSSESTLVKMPHCWKSHALAQFYSHAHCNQADILMVFNAQCDKLVTASSNSRLKMIL